MEREAMMRRILIAVRVITGAVFLYAGAGKALAPAGFALDILNYKLVSPDAALLLGLYIPWLEIAAGLAMIFRRLYAGALAVIGGLLLIFTAALASAAVRGLDIACGCFRAGEGHGHAVPLVRDLLLLGGVILLGVCDLREGGEGKRI